MLVHGPVIKKYRQGVQLHAIELSQVELPLVEPLVAAHGTIRSRLTTFVHATTDEGEGWGECVALNEPTYIPEWNSGEFAVMREVLVPALLRTEEVLRPDGITEYLSNFKGHLPAKAALEMAFLDAHLRSIGKSFADFVGATADRVRCCVVVGLVSGDALVRAVENRVEQGYGCVKLKLTPGQDIERIDLVQSRFPELELRGDANGSYSWADPRHRALLKEIDERSLTMLEQPLAPGLHRPLLELREELQTPISLDESVHSWDDAMSALDLKMVDVMGVKPCLIGGHIAAVRLHDECQARKVPLVLGGMIETGLGRAPNVALAALPGFGEYPAEVTPDDRWFSDRINVDPVVMTADGYLPVPRKPGIGATVDEEIIRRLTRQVHSAKR